MKFKVVSWNIWGGKHLDEVIEFLKAADADIIALQEIVRDERAGNSALTIAKELGFEAAYELGMKIPSAWTGPAREKEEVIDFGTAIISKHKIVGSEALSLSVTKPRTAIRADIQAGDSVLHVFSVHLRHQHVRGPVPEAEALQREQVATLINLAPRERTIIYEVKSPSYMPASLRMMAGMLPWITVWVGI